MNSFEFTSLDAKLDMLLENEMMECDEEFRRLEFQQLQWMRSTIGFSRKNSCSYKALSIRDIQLQSLANEVDGIQQALSAE
jgi:hypothetical protein